MPSQTTYTLQELADLGQVTPRTVRYYIAQGLLPASSGAGPGARYTNAHLNRIRLIRKLQRAHLPLAAIRTQLAALDDAQIAELADSESPASATNSAVDYIRAVMGDGPTVGAPAPLPAAPMAAAPMRMRPMVVAPLSEAGSVDDEPSSPSGALERSQWERIGVTPDIELHVRRPLTRHHNRRVDRLIAIARELFEEE